MKYLVERTGKSNYVRQDEVREDLMFLAIELKSKAQKDLLKIIKDWKEADKAAQESYKETSNSELVVEE